eukprot:SAG31_NODE_25023_length_469_cov_1.470270_1_plen_136_part_01
MKSNPITFAPFSLSKLNRVCLKKNRANHEKGNGIGFNRKCLSDKHEILDLGRSSAEVVAVGTRTALQRRGGCLAKALMVWLVERTSDFNLPKRVRTHTQQQENIMVFVSTKASSLSSHCRSSMTNQLESMSLSRFQ